MSGRIKLLKDGIPIQEDDAPELGYEYDIPGVHDGECGTYGLDSFQLPHDECPEKFVCDAQDTNDRLKQFASCIDSMNCHMMAGMTSSVSGGMDETALFIHQMIPHHQNAVNMAKALIKLDTLQCDDLADEDSEQAADCAMEVVLRSIITEQNAQIQTMRDVLESKNFPPTNDCKVPFSASPFKRRTSNKKKEQTYHRNDNALEGGICKAACSINESIGDEVCTFTAKVNLFASELGYFQFEECGDVDNPTIGLEVGKTYHFIQKDPSNQ